MGSKEVIMKLKPIERKKYLNELGLAKCKLNDDLYEPEYRRAKIELNKKYLKSDSTKWTDETDNVLRSLYNLKKAGIKNFKLSEFRCKCGKYCNGYPEVLSVNLLKNLQTLRDKTGSITITSGLRCKGYNSTLRGAYAKSGHLVGRAVDIYIPGLSDGRNGRTKIKNLWKRLPNYQYTYSADDGNFPNMGNAVHIEVSK